MRITLRYGTMGMLEDLWPYIENDPDLGREGVMEHVLECAEQDGKLYMVFDSFTFGGLVGAKSVVGDRLSWTLDGLRAALETMPEGCSILRPETTKTELLKALIQADLDGYIDWETGTCSFDSEEFKTFCLSATRREQRWGTHPHGTPHGPFQMIRGVYTHRYRKSR